MAGHQCVHNLVVERIEHRVDVGGLNKGLGRDVRGNFIRAANGFGNNADVVFTRSRTEFLQNIINSHSVPPNVGVDVLPSRIKPRECRAFNPSRKRLIGLSPRPQKGRKSTVFPHERGTGAASRPS
jgi:hypothetical protein